MKTLAAGALILSMVSTAHAGRDVREEITRDLVTVTNGEMIFERHALCSMTGRKLDQAIDLQYKLSVSAPTTSKISRDYFAFMSESIHLQLKKNLKESLPKRQKKRVEFVSCNEIPQPIGKPDVTTLAQMTNDGIQITFEANDHKERKTMLWSNLSGW